MQLCCILLFSFFVTVAFHSVSNLYKPSTVDRVTGPFTFTVAKYRRPGLFFNIKRKTPHISSSNSSGLGLLLLLCGDISLNPGPTFGFSNVRSVKNKHASISDYISSSGFNIVGLTETWLSSNETAGQLNEITPDGFSTSPCST